MEETVRILLQNQDPLEGAVVDPLDLMKAYKDKLLEEMWKQQDSLEGPPLAPSAPGRLRPPGAGSRPKDEADDHSPLLERLRALEEENSALSMENDNQRKQYERCLDEVANQVVQALLTQKDLREECVKLRTRVFDLEQQNRILNVLFQQRLKTSSSPVAQEAQRNGKAGTPSGRWPSLLSLTCPRSSCSSSEASLSSAGSEYSSGSHTWTDGRGSSKQCALSREKRMSAGSVSSNHSTVPSEHPDLGWKEGHILKGLKRLQMRSPKEASFLVPTSHYKDCMTSNEGIYSLGVKCGPQGMVPKLAVTKAKTFKPGAEVPALPSDSDDADDDPPQSGDTSSKESPSPEDAGESGSGASYGKARSPDGSSSEEPVKLTGSSGNFLSTVTENVFPEDPTLIPGVSLTESSAHSCKPHNSDQGETSERPVFKKWKEKDGGQSRSGERKSRLDLVKQQQSRVADKQAGARDMSLPIQHTAAQVLSWASEARQRSASMDMPHYREKANQVPADTKDYTILESPQRKPKPQACDSARKAFILRSKSADGGPEQPKQLHSPLHQKLIKVHHRPKGRSNPLVHNIPSAKSNFTKVQSSSKVSQQMAEKIGNTAGPAILGCVETAGQGSLSAVKQSKTFKDSGFTDGPKSPSKALQPASKLPSRNDSAPKGPTSNNLPNSPLKQRCQDQPSTTPHPGLRSPSPPLPPGRTTSLLVRPGYDSLPQAHKPAVQTANSAKAATNGNKPQAVQQSPIKHMQTQVPIKTQDARHKAPKMGASPKRVPSKVHHTLQESNEADSTQLSNNRLTSHEENYVQNVAICQQGISDQQAPEVSPQGSSVCLGIINNPHLSISRAVKTALPVGGKAPETSPMQANTFLVLGRRDQNESNSARRSKAVQAFNLEAHSCQMLPSVNAAVAKAKAERKIETRCSSLDSEPPVAPPAVETGTMLDWGFDEEGWLFKRSVSVSTRPPLKPVMGMNGAKARSQSFGARYMDRPNVSRSGKVRTQIKTHSGSSLNSLGDVFQGSMSCSNSYHCPMNRSLLNNFLIEEGLPIPSHLGASNDRFSLKHQREQANRVQIEQQLSSAFGEPVPGEFERQTTITTIEEKVMLGIEKNLQKSQEQDRTTETKPKSGSSLANWFGFRKSKLPAPSGKKGDLSKVKEEKKEHKIGSLLGGKQAKTDKKKERRKSDGKESSVGRRESHDAVRQCLSMPVPGAPIHVETDGHTDISGDAKMKKQRVNLRPEDEHGAALKTPSQDPVINAIMCSPRAPSSGRDMRTLDSGIGTIPLPDSTSFFSSILHLLPKSASTPDPSLSPPSAPASSSEEISPSPLPRWRLPSKDHFLGMQNSMSDTSVTLVQSVPYPIVTFLQPVQSLSEPVVACASECETQSKLPRLASGGVEPKRMSHIKTKTRPTQTQLPERAQPQLAI
ncbi:nck-associated protein 5-like [Osmerus mordax]|uniref:nck-associated protein 5-like n=1 Tax=Osmerus mordax TaxID=8014 RepID=UPI00350FF21F